MTGQRPDELRPAEMLCVEGDSWHALEEAVTYALLRAGHQPSRDGE